MRGLGDTAERNFRSWYRSHPDTLNALLGAIGRVAPAEKRQAVEQAAFMLLPDDPVSPERAVRVVEALDSKALQDLHMGLIEDVRKVVSDQSPSWERAIHGRAESRVQFTADVIRMNSDERRRFGAQLAAIGVEPRGDFGNVAPAAALLELDTGARDAFVRDVQAHVEREEVRPVLSWLAEHAEPARRVTLVSHLANMRRSLPPGDQWNELRAMPWLEAMRDVPVGRLDEIRGQTLRLLFGERPPSATLVRFLGKASALDANALEQLVNDTLRLSEGLPVAPRVTLAMTLAEDPPELREARMRALAPILQGEDTLERRVYAYEWLQRAARSGREPAVLAMLTRLHESVDQDAWSRVASYNRMHLVDLLSSRDARARDAVLPLATRLLSSTWLRLRPIARDMMRHALENPSFPRFVERLEHAQGLMPEPWMLAAITADVLSAHSTRADLPRLFELAVEFAFAGNRRAARRPEPEAQPRGPAPRVDLDNVHQAGRISMTRRSIILLQQLLPTGERPEFRAVLAHIGEHIEGLRPGLELGRGLGQTRAGALELDNALRTLAAPRRRIDFSDALAANPRFSVAPGNAIGLGELCAMIWHAIDEYPRHASAASLANVARDQANMRHSLILALARSIEDDGHRVCGVGLSQRLVAVLEGYYPAVRTEAPTPAQLLTHHAQAFARDRGEGNITTRELQQYARVAREAADEVFGRGGQDRAAFSLALRQHMAFDFDWTA